MAVKTNFTTDDFIRILSNYKLGEYVSFKAFENGADQTNLLIRTTQRNVVLRYYEKRTTDYAAFEIELLHYLADHSYPCAAPFANKAGKYVGTYNNKPFALFEFLEGQHDDDPDYYKQVAEAIGQLHAITIGYKPSITAQRTYDTAYCWLWAQESAKRIKSKPEATKRLNWMKQQLDQIKLPDNLPKGVCHGDANPTNFLYKNGKLSAVLDFDQASYTWLLYDVAQMIYWWTWPDKGDLDIAKTKALLAVYSKHRPLSDAEHRHLFDALKLVILIGMAWFLDAGEDYDNARRKVDSITRMNTGMPPFVGRIGS